MWKRFWKKRACAEFILTSPKEGIRKISLAETSDERLKLLLENHAYALHFTGAEEELLGALRRLARRESMSLNRWRVFEGDKRVAQVHLSGEREIRRLVSFIKA